MQYFQFNVLFHKEDDGGYSVSVPALPGCFSQGENFEQATENIKEAINLYLQDEPKKEEYLKYN
ncbi:MAG: type II toxin-antitoxin system HicB family antitoxin [Patescibacteria group bacterium]